MVLSHDTPSECALQIYEVSLKYLGFQVIERTRCCDGQIDVRKGENNMPPEPSRGRHKYCKTKAKGDRPNSFRDSIFE